jgi:predicted lipid-binding transport protein (Tim44 family)
VKRLLVFALAAFASFAIVQADVADAARIGGGRSFGMQRSIVPPAPKVAPSTGSMSGPAANPVMPAKPGVSAAQPAAGAAAAGAQRAGASRWLGPIAGIAAGLGLAALFSHLGLSEGLGSLLLIGLLVVAAVALMRAFASRRTPAPQYAGNAAARSSQELRREPVMSDAWGSGNAVREARYPPGFDPAPFVAQAKQQFRRLQAAYDRGDRALLADVTTPEMQAEIVRDLEARRTGGPTEVITLDADVVEVVQEADRYVASVRFYGTLREDGQSTTQPFDEMWHLVKPVNGLTGWLLAGIQQYA